MSSLGSYRGWLAALVVLVACGGGSNTNSQTTTGGPGGGTDAGGGIDAGGDTDAGAATDAGSAADAGGTHDGGTADGGIHDGGTTDGGSGGGGGLTLDQVVVGAWGGSSNCNGSIYIEHGFLVCPGHRLRGYDKLDNLEFVDCGTWATGYGSSSGRPLIEVTYQQIPVLDPSNVANLDNLFY